MKIRPVAAELFHVEWQTDRYGRTFMTKLIVVFYNFANGRAYKITKMVLVQINTWQEAISHALGARICNKRCGRECGWVWRCEVPDTDGTALTRDSDGSSPGLRSLHAGYHRYYSALLPRADKPHPAFEKPARKLKCVEGSSKFTTGGDGINTIWWPKRAAMVLTVLTDGTAAGPVDWERLFL